ncbi:MAG TPA: hypothetical protein VF941_24570, partial [Clostridia bacterium]
MGIPNLLKRAISVLLCILFVLPFASVNVSALTLPSLSSPTATFTIQPSGTGYYMGEAVGLPNDKTAVLVYQYPSWIYYVRIYDSSGNKITDVNVSNLMTTKFSSEEYHLFGLANGNIVLTYNKSDSSVVGSNAAYFIVIDQSGNRIVNETKINTYDGTLLNRWVSMAQLDNGNIAFAWQRGDNFSFATRVFTTSGSPVTAEILVETVNTRQISIAASTNGTYMVQYSYYVDGSGQNKSVYKIYNNDGTFSTSGVISTTTDSTYTIALSNGNYLCMIGNFNTVGRILDPTGATLQDNIPIGSSGRGNVAIVNTSGGEGFVALSYDSDYLDAMNNSSN